MIQVFGFKFYVSQIPIIILKVNRHIFKY